MWRLGHLKIMTSCNEPNPKSGRAGVREREMERRSGSKRREEKGAGRQKKTGQERETDRAWQPQTQYNTGNGNWQRATGQAGRQPQPHTVSRVGQALWQAKVACHTQAGHAANRDGFLQLSTPIGSATKCGTLAALKNGRNCNPLLSPFSAGRGTHFLAIELNFLARRCCWHSTGHTNKTHQREYQTKTNQEQEK